MNSFQQLSRDFWQWEAFPVGVIVANACTSFHLSSFSEDYRATFEIANQKLLNWWPHKKPLLISIYGKELYESWSIYYSIPPESKMEQIASLLIEGLYVQFKLLEPHEKYDPEIPLLPNDIHDMVAQNLQHLMETTFNRIPSENQQSFLDWLESLKTKGSCLTKTKYAHVD